MAYVLIKHALTGKYLLILTQWCIKTIELLALKFKEKTAYSYHDHITLSTTSNCKPDRYKTMAYINSYRKQAFCLNRSQFNSGYSDDTF